MRESELERKFVASVKALGGAAFKFITTTVNGMPDRLVCLPHGRVVFVELKAPGCKPRPLQIKRHDWLRGMGFDVRVIDQAKKIEAFVSEFQNSA